MDEPDRDSIPHSQRLGVIVERRESDNQWIDAIWRTVEVVPEFVADDAWKPLTDGDGWRRFLAGSLEVELFKRETEAYKMNFSQSQPVVYVVLRPGEDDSEPDVVPFLATLSPYEAEDYAESGEIIVDAVPMPPFIAAWAASYIDIFHVDQPFKKRKQKRKDASAADRSQGPGEGPRHGR